MESNSIEPIIHSGVSEIEFRDTANIKIFL
jgi:hypothetical protein